MLTLIVDKLRFPAIPISTPITVSLYIKEYYGGSYALIDSAVPVDVNGNILSSPKPFTTVDPAVKYELKAVNELCGEVYTQNLFINPYCPTGYTLASDESSCFIIVTTDATPPTSPENTVVKSAIQYSTCGSYIYNPGFNINGTGTSTQITLANAFWKNGGTCADNTTVDGPMNRSALWATTTADNQDVGFAICITITESKTYFIGVGCDNRSIIKFDGNVIVSQDEAALDAQYSVGGACFKVWHIYPLNIIPGTYILECIGHNDSGIAAFACQVYNNTAAEIIAATNNSMLNFIFNSADFVGMPVQLGTGGIGYTCPSGYALAYCESPIVCKKVQTTPVLY